MKKLFCMLLVIVMLSVPVQVSAEGILIDDYQHIDLINEDIIPCFSGVITYCTNPDCERKPTVLLVCQGVYADTLINITCTDSSHSNCDVYIERYYATGSCTLCGQGYVLAHNEYAYHSVMERPYHLCYYN